MWYISQWLWDRELQCPVQYQGITIKRDGPSTFHVLEPDLSDIPRPRLVEKVYEFSGADWWKNRYATLFIECTDPAQAIEAVDHWTGGTGKHCAGHRQIEIAVQRPNHRLTMGDFFR